jgi:hypothetical protein
VNVWTALRLNGTMNGVLQAVCIPFFLAARVVALFRQRPS